MFVLYKMAFHFLTFNLERHQRELFSPGQLQWLLPPMEVSKLRHPTKSYLWRSDDGLIPEKSQVEVYLGSMELKHTTRFTRKKRAKKETALFTFWPILALEALLLLYILDTIFCPLLMLYSYWQNVLWLWFLSLFLGTGYKYNGNIFVAWVLQVRRAEVVTKWSTGFRTWTPIFRKLIMHC